MILKCVARLKSRSRSLVFKLACLHTRRLNAFADAFAALEHQINT